MAKNCQRPLKIAGMCQNFDRSSQKVLGWVDINICLNFRLCNRMGKIWYFKNICKQEWSSMESNSYENWDEIEMFFWSISNWQLAIWIRQCAIWQNGVSGYLEVSGEFSNQDLKIWIPYYCVWKVVVVVVETRDLSLTIVCFTSFLGRDLMLNN